MDPFRQNCSASARMARCSSCIGETVRMLLGVTLLQREVLEAKAGGASTVTGGDEGDGAFDLDGAQRAVQWNRASRKPSENKARMRWSCDCKNAMWPRETTAHSGDIGAVLDRHRQSQWLRVLQRSTAVCAAAKNTKSLAARRVRAVPTVSRFQARMRDETWLVEFSVSDVAARDVQAATSPRIG